MIGNLDQEEAQISIQTTRSFNINITPPSKQNQKCNNANKIYSSSLYIWGTFKECGNESINDKIKEANNRQKYKDQDDINDFLSSTEQSCSLKMEFEDKVIVSVNCGKSHAGIISDKGELFMIGSNDGGQLGIGENTSNKIYDNPIMNQYLFKKGLVIDQVACGHSHTIALSKTGQIFSFGYGKFGALGLSHYESRNTPTQIMYFSNYQSSMQIAGIQCGAHHSALLDKSGQLYVWGAGEVGQLGLRSRSNECSPKIVEISYNNQERVQSVTCGYFHTLIITTNGRVMQTGQYKTNTEKQDFQLQTVFTEINDIPKSSITQIKTKDYSVALNKSGNLLFWYSPYQLYIIDHNLLVDDFELCKQFILIRCGNRFFKWKIDVQSMEEIISQHYVSFNDLSILSCGHQYIIGTQTQKLRLKSYVDLSNSRQEYLSKTIESKKRNHLKNEIDDYQRRHSFGESQKIQYPKNTEQLKSSVSQERTSHQYFGPYHIDLRDSQNESSLLIQEHNQQQSLHKNQSLNSSPQVKQQFDQSEKCNSSNLKNKNSQNNQQCLRISDHESNNISSQNKSQAHLLQPKQIQPAQSIDFSLINDNQDNRQIQHETEKEDLKDQLQIEIDKRIKAEKDLEILQQDFEIYKREVGVEQMKIVLQESQSEYQKLYEICVQECEKGTKFNEIWKKEKKIREEREVQIYEMGEENLMLKNQISYLEEQLTKIRDEKEEEIKQAQNFQELQKSISVMQHNFQLEKEQMVSKIFEMEQTIEKLKEENTKLNESNISKKQEIDTLQENIKEFKFRIKQLSEVIANKNKEIVQTQEYQCRFEKLQKENQILQEEVQQLQSTIQIKNVSLKECDQIISQLKINENDLKLKLQQSSKQQSSTISQNCSQNNSSIRKTSTNTKYNLRQSTSQHKFNNTLKKNQQQQQLLQQIPQKIEQSTKKKEQSPEKLKKMMDIQDESTQNFINEISKMVGNGHQRNYRQKQIINKIDICNENVNERSKSQIGASKQSNKTITIASAKPILGNQSRNINILQSVTSNCQQKQQDVILEQQKTSIFDSKCFDYSINSTELQTTDINSINTPSTFTHSQQIQQNQEIIQNELTEKIQMQLQIESKEILTQEEIPEQQILSCKPQEIHDEEINQLYASINADMKGLQISNVDNLKEKLDTIRKNKLLLEQKIKEYEKKLEK